MVHNYEYIRVPPRWRRQVTKKPMLNVLNYIMIFMMKIKMGPTKVVKFYLRMFVNYSLLEEFKLKL